MRKLFGDEVVERVGPIWGFGEGQELRNMYTRTGQPGLWFIAGGLAQCRINSKYLALQIKAIEEGRCCGRGGSVNRHSGAACAQANTNPESATIPGLRPSDHPGMTDTTEDQGRQPHADHPWLRRASLPRRRELGEASRRLEPDRCRFRRGRQQGPHLCFQPRRPSDGGVRSRRQFHHKLGRRAVQPRARAAYRRRR